MPLYEYRCAKCAKLFEVMQRFSDAPLTEHEDCGGPVERLISPPALQFKGTGWYVNDYAKSAPQSAESKSDGKDSKPKPAENKPDTKPPATTTRTHQR